MSCDIKYIGMDVHKEAVVIAVLNSSGKLVMESIVETRSQQHSAVYPRSAGGTACHLGRRDLGGLALRSFAAPGSASAGLRSASQCLIKGRQQERQDRRTQVGRLVTHGNGATGLSRGTRTADAERTGAQLSDHQPSTEPSEHNEKSSVSRLEHPLCGDPGVCSALSGTVATED